MKLKDFFSMQSELEHFHTQESIQERLTNGPRHNYLGDFLLGAIDGCVTTLAVVAGVEGAHLSYKVAVVLGLANLLADGFSMAAGNYQNTKSESELLDKARRMEEKHIEQVPEGEIEEVRQIYAKKGFDGDLLERIVKVITSNKKIWVDTMLQEELGLRLEGPKPILSATTTFLAFVGIGLIPLWPYIFDITFLDLSRLNVSFIFTAFAFFFVGAFKGKILDRPLWLSGLETLGVGSLAASLSYVIGYWLKGF